MVFSSSIFLFLFLPIFFTIYFLTPDKWRSAVIVLASYIFYAWWRVDFLLLFFAVTAVNFWLGIKIEQALGDKERKQWLIGGLAVNLATLGYFKYANFGVDSINTILLAYGMEPLQIGKILLPIGVSFYIFESISYLMDVYRREIPATRRFLDFSAFVALFPHLIAGPILRFKDLSDQFANRTHTLDKTAEGCARFMQGFIKKVFIADTIAPLADQAFALEQMTTGDAWLGALAYTAQLYFDFSGYSDMAIGLGLMMGFRFMENFNRPYFSQSITEFWQRWHISLSSWLKNYLYFSLGGNRHGQLKTYRNLFITMLLGGLWHGANWTFIIWGAWQGMWLAIERALGVKVDASKFRPVRWLITFLLVVIGWVIFRATNVENAMMIYKAMFSFGDFGLSQLYSINITKQQIFMLVVAYAILVLDFVWSRKPATTTTYSKKWAYSGAAILLPLFALSVLKLASELYSPFLYFQF
ncbi:MAG TPA: MBOAT family protein [Cellvibrio sp.]|nr:MBOAT family protein [Cellvibrio sp.]